MFLIAKSNGEIPRDTTGSFYVFGGRVEAEAWIDEMEGRNTEAGGKPVGYIIVNTGRKITYCGGCEKPFISIAEAADHMWRENH